jgi:hypothetical protein
MNKNENVKRECIRKTKRNKEMQKATVFIILVIGASLVSNT